ncbi:hypothetical protein ILUMI_26686 [Ignelater luminosus]|uniref:DNA-directed RNA polymerase III subunit RPC3 n=1 Tax=Ignelater luminosus TaxID=2038154 RepID=A0A8K0C687_IGNLU|nr:hypothetical protein ILUMI_26686 [Ignelater luminosus]
MSLYQGKLLHLILLERFGPIVADVGKALFEFPRSLFHVRKTTGFPLLKVKESLSILIKFNLASFKLNHDGTTATYRLIIDNILLMLRYPKFINLIKMKMEDEAETLVEELLYKGCSTASELIIKTATRLKENKDIGTLLKQLKDKFASLVTAKYFIRLKNANTQEQELFAVPTIDLKQLSSIMNGSDETPADESIYWTLNPDRFHQDLRDQLVVNAVTNKFDENTGELMRIFLQQMYIRTSPWVPVSNLIPVLEVKDIVKKQKTHPQLLAFFDQYVNILEQDGNNIIQKAGEASGGSFQIEMKKIFTQLTWEIMEQLVNEKFDTKASRIFRLVKCRRYIEPEEIQHLVMMPSKEVKRITYQLFEENFVLLNELKRSITNSGPNKSFTLFYIQLTQLVRTTLELSYKTLFNIMTRRHHEKFLNKRIIDKKQRVDTISMGMRVQGASVDQLTDIEEMITPPEAEALAKIGKMMKKLNVAELEIDDTIFLLQMYLAYE